MTQQTYTAACRRLCETGAFFLLALLALAMASPPLHAAVTAPISGEILRISINDPTDHWSGGTIVVGGQSVIIPRNLLLDLPANRLTLKQLYEQAPAACVALGETGLAKADLCNTSGAGGFATISANVTGAGNHIAGDVLIEKGIEAVTGIVTYIDYNDGYVRINGNLNDPTTGVMVRLNDPTGRHTVQQGLGCAGGPNCSPDPRFTLDPDNYTNVFSTGFPLCIPSTVARTVATALPALSGVPGVSAGTVAQAQADGSGDVLCPTTNRTVNGGQPVEDSRRFAPIMLGDSMSAEGNYENINGVHFLSAHTTGVAKALSTKNQAGQPDYLFLEEVEIDAPAFQNQRVRSLFIGFATLASPATGGADILLWSIHRDPQTNAPHEFPLASVLGCDLAGGLGTCGVQGLVGAGNLIFKIRHDVDFLVGAKAKLNPCAHLRADPRFASLNICPNGGSAELNITEMLQILSPMPHEIQARTGHSLANPGETTLDINGAVATNGQYLFPLGMNLGGIGVPEMVEINLDALGTPVFFSGIPWNLDRRLSPGGCNGACEATPQPLDPFPWEGLDPRFQASLPTNNLTDPNYTNSLLIDVRNRIRSYVDGTLVRSAGNGHVTPAPGNFDGMNTLLDFPVADAPALPIVPTLPVELVCTAGTPAPAEVFAVSQAQFRTSVAEWRVSGTSSVEGATVTVHLGPIDGPVIGSATVAAGAWTVVAAGSAIVPTIGDTLSIESTGGASVTGIAITLRR